MALILQTSVYAINGIEYNPPISMGIKTADIRKVQPTHDGNNKWIGTNYLSTLERNSVYTQLKVAKDNSNTSVDNIYVNRTVTQMVTAINA